ncbi:MAG: DsbA family protein [Patescibacteria group bacterium]|nr:DsbA family protein [Patescibacteria group bacterium]
MLTHIKKNLGLIIIILVILALSISLYFLGGKVQKREVSSCQNNLKPTTPVELGNLPPYGNPNAPIKIVEFSDYLCPFCAKAAIEFYPKIEPLVRDGQVALYYRDFSVHPEAEPIANAARCANEQGRFWEFNKKIFEELLAGKNTTRKEIWTEIAQTLNLDTKNFDACVDENRYNQDIKNDMNYSLSLNLGGTPNFFIQKDNMAFQVVGIDENCLLSGIEKLQQQ